MASENISRYTFANQNLNNQKLKFLSGLQSNLNTLITNGGAVEGAFYLTTDTHRLYIGRTITADGGTSVSKTIPIPVNEGITTIADINALNNTNANVGEFYYIEDGNILAVKSGTGWIQLNNDTNDTIEVSTVSLVKDSTQNNANAISYTLTINQTKKNKDGSSTGIAQPAAVTTSLTILKSDIIAAISVGIGSKAVSGNSTEISLSGDGADTSKKVTITGAGSVALSGTANNITITGTDTTYDLQKPADSTTVTLKDKDNNADTVIFGVKENTENLAVDGSEAGKIKYYHIGAGTATGSAGANTAGTVNFGSSFNVPSISRDANGHIVSLSDVSLTLPELEAQTPKAAGALNADNTGKVSLEMVNGDIYDSTANNPSGKTGVLFHTLTVDGTASTVYNQGDLGSFYSASKVDEKIATATKGINAMTYKGTVGSADSTVGNAILPTSNVSIGDTYLVDDDRDITTNSGDVSSKKGDLYIAVSSDGKEDADGHIASSKLGWTRVEAGDVDTQYSLQNTTGSDPSLKSVDSNGDETTIQVVGGDHIDVTGAAGKITIDHSAPVTTGATAVTPGTGTTLTHGGKLNIPKFSYDSKGHIASAGTEEFTLPSVDEYKLNHSTDVSGGTSDTTIRLWKGTNNTGIGSVTLEGDGNIISTASSANGIQISHATKTVHASFDFTAADIPAAGIEVVTEVGYDNYGHINKYVTHKYKVPTAVTYGLDDGVDTAYSADTVVNNVTWQIKDSAGTTSGLGEAITLGSDSLQLKRTGASAYKADIVWGSF